MKLSDKISRWIDRWRRRLTHIYNYCVEGVWSDTRNSLGVKLIKTLNLSVRAFFNGDIQTKACAMTYRTMLALVPALALVFAIGRGFGLQDLIKDEIIKTMPSEGLWERAFSYVDSYLNTSASSGVFMGVGIVLLLWTLVSILSAVEKSFNDIWGIRSGRSYWRKITDYLAIFLILPVLMISASGITVFVSTAVERVLPFEFISPLTTILLDLLSLALIWLFFTGVYKLMPNTKVKFRNAFIAGIFAGTAFMILQWLFISGQIYVSKYNAIYGSVAFLPLFMIWVQFTWVICLSGGVICYASQNIYNFNFSREVSHISHAFRLKVVVSLMAIIVKRFLADKHPLTLEDIEQRYGFPSNLVTQTVDFLVEAGLLLRVVDNPKVEQYGYAPALDPYNMTVADVVSRVREHGMSDFLPNYRSRFASVIAALDKCESALLAAGAQIYIKDLDIDRVDHPQTATSAK